MDGFTKMKFANLSAFIVGIVVLVLYLKPNYMGYQEADILHRVFETQIRMGYIVAYLDNIGPSSFPDSINDFPFASDATADPFGDGSFYLMFEGKSWQLVSVGPDRVNDYEAFGVILPYDPTNGIVSSGDIVFTERITPKGVLASSSGTSEYKRHGSWSPSYEGWRKVE